MMAEASDLAIYLNECCSQPSCVQASLDSYCGRDTPVDGEPGNTEDRFAVAVIKDDTVVGHVPRESQSH